MCRVGGPPCNRILGIPTRDAALDSEAGRICVLKDWRYSVNGLGNPWLAGVLQELMLRQCRHPWLVTFCTFQSVIEPSNPAQKQFDRLCDFRPRWARSHRFRRNEWSFARSRRCARHRAMSLRSAL